MYVTCNGNVATEPSDIFKQWMLKHEYDPEHGKNTPLAAWRSNLFLNAERSCEPGKSNCQPAVTYGDSMHHGEPLESLQIRRCAHSEEDGPLQIRLMTPRAS